MKSLYFFIIFICTLCSTQSILAQSGCIEIKSILVNSCAPGNAEGKNEMVRFKVESSDLQTSDMNVQWANTNLGWNGLTMDALTAQKTAEFNASIISCGLLREPLDGVLPANSEVILITSYNVSTANNFFSQLGDTLYVIYANDNTNSGHVLNYQPNPNPDAQTVVISFNSIPGCSDAVTYHRTELTTTAGNIGDEDGATVNFTDDGLATYINIGCIAPYTPFSAEWTIPEICFNTSPINLNNLVTGSQGGTWTGPGVTGNAFDPAGLSGDIQITYSVGAGACTQTKTQTVTIYPQVDATWTPPATLCSNAGLINLDQYVSGTTPGYWFGPGVSGTTLFTGALSGDITIHYSVGVGSCSDTEAHTIFIQALNANWSNPGTICAESGTINLQDFAPANVQGTWSGQNVTDSIFNPSGLSGAAAITFSVSINGCNLSNTQSIQIDTLPNTAWTNPGFLCDTSLTVMLDNLIEGQTGGSWTGNGVSINIFDPAAIVDSSVVTYSISGAACQSSQSHTIYAGTVPIPVVSGDTSYCSADTPNALSVNSIPGVSVFWYSDSLLSNQISSLNTYTPALTSDQTFYLIQSIGTCSSDTAQFSITVALSPASPVTQTNVTYCENTSIPLLTATSTTPVFWYSDATLQNEVHQGLNYQPTQTNTTFWLNAQNGECASSTVSIQLSSLPLATVSITVAGSADICHGSEVVLMASSNEPVQWSNGSQTNELTVSQSGLYTASASNTCNTASDNILVNDITPDASFELSSLEGYAPLTINVNPVSTAGCDWFINGNSSSLVQNQIVLTDVGSYTIKHLCDNAGCLDSVSRNVSVTNGTFSLELPNSFTPNGDGYNDFFKAKFNGVTEFKSTIFDRWGQEVYSWEGVGNSWDGTKKGNPVADGVYFYVIKGKDFTSQDFERYGSVTLLRN